MRLVIHNGAREMRGNERMTATLAQALQERGHRVVVSCHPRGALRHRLERLGVPHVFHRPGGDLDVWSALRFWHWLRAERPDVVLLTTWKRTPWAAWAARRAGVRHVVVRLGIVRRLPGDWRYRVAYRRWVDRLLVNSREIRDAWLDSAPAFPPAQVRLVLNGIDLPARPERSTLREELAIPEDAPVLVGVGGLEERKGFDLLLEALARLSDRRTHLVIAGSGPAEGALRLQTETLGIAERVHFLGQRSYIGNVLAGSDLFVLSSRNEGMAVAMLEAMAARVPVVATDVSGVQEALGAVGGRGPAGWIVPREDPAALAGGIEAALAAREAASPSEGRCAEAEFRVRHWFSKEAMVEGVEKVLFEDVRGAEG